MLRNHLASNGKRITPEVGLGAGWLEIELTPYPPQARCSSELPHRDENLSGDKKPLGVPIHLGHQPPPLLLELDDDGVGLRRSLLPEGVTAHQRPPEAFTPLPLIWPAAVSPAYV